MIGAGRYIGTVVNSFSSLGLQRFGGETFLVRGPAAVRPVSSEASADAGVLSTFYLEALEGAASFFISRVMIGDDDFLSGHLVTFFFLALTDFAWAGMREYLQNVHYALYVARENSGYGVVAVKIFFSNISDPIFYTAMLFTWRAFLQPAEGDYAQMVFGVAWFIRNFTHRMANRAFWKNFKRLVKRCCQTNDLPLVAFDADEHASIYVTGGQAFVYNWHQDASRAIDLDAIVGVRRRYNWDVRLEAIDTSDFRSWEELSLNPPAQQLALPAPHGNNNDQRIDMGGNNEELERFLDDEDDDTQRFLGKP